MAPDYRKLIDGETWAFIDRINAFYPPEAINWPIGKNREVYDRMSRAFHAGHPAGVGSETAAITTPTHRIPVRIYRSATPNPAATVLYFHGGGFILGGLDSHDDICAELCSGTGYALVSVDYRLAPEHIGTAAFDDSVAALEWAAATYRQPIVLVGESAGGNLAACVAHHARGHARAPIGQVLVYPSLGGEMTKGSYVTHADAPLLTTSDVQFYADVRTGGTDASKDPRYTPLAASDFSGLPAANRGVHCQIRSAVIGRRNVPRPNTESRGQGALAGGARARPRLPPRPPYVRPGGTKLCRHRRGGCFARQGRMGILSGT